MSKLELWGGHECTVNRVGDEWRDQTALSGHQIRLDDLDAFAALGLKALRYPVLWERVAPDFPNSLDFTWSDARLARLAALGVRAIVGLVHHGAGPRYTHLLDDGFAPGLARYARAVAERYPHVEDWTPVNEPLTTARFACLYGVWHPHTRDERAFYTALLNEIDATRLAMRAIRAVNPRARLIATDDLGFTHATPQRAPQAAFENDRRWLSWDLLFGRVTRDHPMHRYIARLGLAGRLAAIADDPCPPDVVGVNHYLTSERFLDHRLDRPGLLSGDHAAPTITTEVLRAAPRRATGLTGVLRECWDRYGAPIAVTEVHNGCTREEQMRWFHRCWRDAEAVRAEGVDVRAVTAWALIGSHGWDKLCTGGGTYEVGVFDGRSTPPRPTAMAPLLRALGAGRPVPQPRLLKPRGWWETRDMPAEPSADDRPILITGRTGTLGQALARDCGLRNLPHLLTGRETLDLLDPAGFDRALDTIRPWAVINAAGLVDIDRAEREPDLCDALNAHGPAKLAAACAARGIAFVHVSSDQVFDGARDAPYTEDDAVGALNAYGRAKAASEAAVLAAHPGALVARTSAFFSARDPYNFAHHALSTLSRGEPFHAALDQLVSPTHVPDLTRALLDLAVDGERGVWHLANAGAATWADFAARLADAADLDANLVRAVPAATFGWPAPRPARVALASSRGQQLPTLDDAIERMVAEWRSRPAPAAAGLSEALGTLA